MTDSLSFPGLEIRHAERVLLVHGQPVLLGARAFDVLACLAENRDRVVRKEELLERVWPDLSVEEGNLTVQISSLRKTLGKDVITTVTGYGYRFTPPEDKTSAKDTGPTPTEKPSIAVLAFANLSGDAGQDYFVDGVVGDIINGLSRVRAFFVIAQNSTFTFKGKNVSPAQIGEELGVRYLLEGAFQQAGDKLRISTQLVEAVSGRTIWSEKFSGNRSDVFLLQDEITSKTVAALEPRISRAEAERVQRLPTDNLQAYELCLRALPNTNLMTSREKLAEAVSLIEAAIVIDPDYSFAKALHGWAYTMAFASRWIDFDTARAALLHNQDALHNHHDDPMTLTFAGHTAAYLERDLEAGITALELALKLNPNCLQALASLGWLYAYRGDGQRALESLNATQTLSPLDPLAYAYISGIGHAHMCEGQFEKAITTLEQSYQLFPDFISTLIALVPAYALVGRVKEARKAAVRLLQRQPELTIKLQLENTPFKGKTFRDAIERGLRIAGIPEG